MDDRRTPEDPGSGYKIKMGQEDEVRYWCEKFGVSKAKLEDAVNAVGAEIGRIQEYLARRRD